MLKGEQPARLDQLVTQGQRVLLVLLALRVLKDPLVLPVLQGQRGHKE